MWRPHLSIFRGLNILRNIDGGKLINRLSFFLFRLPLVAWKSFSKKERLFFGLLLALMVSGAGLTLGRWYLKNTAIAPQIGGSFSEGIVGSPRFIHPVLADTNDADSATEALIFSGLFRVDYRGGLQYDLAEGIEQSEDRKTYLVTLKQNLRWHDNRPLTTEDVLYTLDLIKNPILRSPLAATWQGVVVEPVSDRTIKFVLREPYELFLQNLTFRILPKHIWERFTADQHLLSEFILKPIGSGPYRFRSLQRDRAGNITQYTLIRNPRYYHQGPYLETITLKFYKSPSEAFLAFRKKEIDGLANLEPATAEAISREDENFKRIVLPRYFAVFFNGDLALFQEPRMRQALSAAVDKERIVREVFLGYAGVLHGPIPAGLEGALPEKDIEVLGYNAQETAKLLGELGWKDDDGNGILEKKIFKKDKHPTPLTFTLTLPATPETEKVGELLKEMWQAAGIRVTLRALSTGEMSNIIQARSYETLLFGEILNQKPDPFSFWHSSQKGPPGLNLSLYSSKQVDRLLEQARQARDPKKRVEALQEFQKILIKDMPAIFLYTPFYIYALPQNLHVPEMRILNLPEERFSRINEWYSQTRRTRKTR